MAEPKIRLRFRLTIMSGICAIVLIMTALTTVIVAVTGESNARRDALVLFSQTAVQVKQRLDSRLDLLTQIADMGSAAGGMGTAPRDSGQNHPGLPFLFRAVSEDPAIYAVYTGYADGSFLMLINAAGDPRILAAHQAPSTTRYILRTITGHASRRLQTWTYLDQNRQVIATRREAQPSYDPRQRPWYQGALDKDRAFLGDAYIFNSLLEPGLTASRTLDSGAGVFGVDMTLAGLRIWLDQSVPSPRGGIMLLDGSDRLLAASANIIKWLPKDFASLGSIKDTSLMGEGQTLRMDNEPFLRYTGSWSPEKGRNLKVLIFAPLNEFTAFLMGMRSALFLLAGAVLLLAFPAALVVSGRISRMLGSLADDAQKVSDLDFSGSFDHRTMIVEFDQLGRGFQRMKDALNARTETLNSTLLKLERVVELGISMSAEKDANRLVETILQGAKGLAHADAGSLYLRNADGTSLEFQIILTDSLGFFQGGTSGKPITLKPVRLFDLQGQQNHHNVVSHAFHTGKTVNIPDAYNAEHFDFSGTRIFDEMNKYRSTSFLTVPLRPLGGAVIGALQLINSKDPVTGGIVPFSPEVQRLVEALAAEAATTIANRDLLAAQEHLFDALIQFIAGAIDTKSHYTGSHCARVPELALMLAGAASEVKEGPLADFGFKNDDEWHEFKIGAWLHDCGKVTTPEFVVDKATKLETIYNRIHEVRTRFEVLLRDERIRALEAKLAGGNTAEIDRNLAEAEARLEADFNFLASCNSGDEAMTPEKLQRIKETAARTWLRHFDNRLGLSWEELERMDRDRHTLGLDAPIPVPATPWAPVQETLLADKPEHRILRKQDFAKIYEGKNFAIQVPELLYNHGELYNLGIARGTLTEEERFKINEHVMQTIVMLEKLPLPETLRKVPLYAGTHHETLKGTGYPRHLGPEDLDIPSRIMAIADIFEALTSSDRPYKKTKTLSECVKVLHFFKKDGHIDPVLFDLFLTSGVYRKYAEEHLRPEQLDDFDISVFLG